MNLKELLSTRLHNQQISSKLFSDPGEVVKWMGGMQAQDYAGSKWSIALRLNGTTESEIEDSIANKSIVRTWAMRGTLHFLHPSDIRWILDLLRPRLNNLYISNLRNLGLDQKTLSKGTKILVSALGDGNQLTRNEIRLLLQKKGLQTNENRLGFVLLRAATDGLICFGPRKEKEFTFTLLDKWLPMTKSLQPEEAMRELTVRYFTSHGPASIQDYGWWSGFPLSEIKRIVESLKHILQEVKFEGQSYWMRGNLGATTPLSGTFLLPGFDEYIVAYKDRSTIIDSKYLKQIVSTPNGIFAPTVISNGKVIGVWKRKLTKKKVELEITQLLPYSDAKKKAITKTARDYGRFIGEKSDTDFKNHSLLNK